MKIILLILLSLSIYASDILTQYRTKGLTGIEKKLDFELTHKDYWSAEIQNIDTSFGYIESYNAVLSCNKEHSTLTLFKKDANATFQEIKQYSAFTGERSGDKTTEGDKKTPLGIYKIDERLNEDTKLDPFYGPLAFVTSYPNLYDQMLGKNGSGIWVHGLPIKRDRDNFTRGCIAIDNPSIECLDNNINIKKTILLINPSQTKQEISKDILASLLSDLYQWRYSWLYDDINSYLSFYNKNFTRFDGMKIKQFSRYKTRVFKKLEKKTILFSEINIFKYPNKKDVYQITFKEYYKSKSFEFTGDKTLLVKVTQNKKMQIFIEK